MTRSWKRRGAAFAATALAITALIAAGGGTVPWTGPELAAGSEERLPDLDQEPPGQLEIRERISEGRRSFLLGFRSAVRNIGDGPLIVTGHRPDTSTRYMTVDQVVVGAGNPPRVVRGIGRMQYAISPDHHHWHYLQFDRYQLASFELRRAGHAGVLVQDQKTGFCLGDRYRVTTRALPAASPEAVYTGRCALSQPGRLRLRSGISVGYGDDYSAYLEGQDLSLDGLPDGRYVLVHRVNANRRLQELSYANNASSALLDLRWHDGKPYVQVLAICPDTARCDQQARVRVVATGLDTPWDIEFLPDGRAFVTERPGRVRLLDRDGGLQEAPVARIAVTEHGEGGLLGLALDPEFASNQYIYLYFTGSSGMRLERWRWTGARLVRQASLVDAIEAGEVHDSGRIAFGPDGRLYVATGDAGQPELAQDPGSLNGKLLALTPGQYRSSRAVRPDIIASGLRNSQGFDWQPGTGALVANDHGPSGFDGPEGYDEVNLIVPGGNYGWPRVIGNATDSGKFIAPLRVYRDAIAPSGATFLERTGTRWTGDYILASLRGEELRRLVLQDGRVVVDEPLLHGTYGRLRTVREGPDDCLYVLTSNRDGRGTPKQGDDRILCVLPPPRP